MVKIKRCPFCGAEAETFHIPENTEEENREHPLWEWKHSGLYAIGCETAMCYGNINHVPMLFLNEELAIETWNRRADDV